MAEKDPYCCCGGHRDTPFCPMCGEKIPRRGEYTSFDNFGSMRGTLCTADDVVNQIAAFDLHANGEGDFWIEFDNILGVWFDLDDRTGVIRLRVFKRREGDNGWEPDDEWCVLEHQLWPFEPKPVKWSLADSNGHERGEGGG